MLTVRNVLNWPRFLALKAFVFLAQIYFLDLAIFGFYNFFVLAFFYLDFPPRLFDYLAQDFHLLGLLLKLFLV